MANETIKNTVNNRRLHIPFDSNEIGSPRDTMNAQDVVDLGREAIILALLMGAPLLLVGTAMGLLIGLLQALTQIQDQTISFVPKFLALAICLPWLIRRMVEYSQELITSIPQTLLGG